jgi:hypothetical protein
LASTIDALTLPVISESDERWPSVVTGMITASSLTMERTLHLAHDLLHLLLVLLGRHLAGQQHLRGCSWSR